MNANTNISIVIPAYNEAERLPQFLSRVIGFCNKSRRKYEIIIVDDGSTDGTYEIASSFRSQFSDLAVIKNRKNRGKGYAVRRGLLRARGDIAVFLDADGSAEADEIEKNLHYLTDEGYDIFVGSRELKGDSQDLNIRWYRKIPGVVFNFLVRTLLFQDIRDTQCGFKMFKKNAVRPILSRCHLRGFGFDIEMSFLAHKMGYKVKEGPVSWKHVPGSKVNMLTEPLKMFIDILRVRNWHYTPINKFEKYLGPDEYAYMYEMEKYHWWFVSRNRLINKLLLSLNMHCPKILDIGCGTGDNLLSFSKIGETFGIDASDKAVEYCLRRGIKNVGRYLAEKTPFEDGTFDVITCLEVLEHIPDPAEALSEARRILKDSGKIIIAVPAFQVLWSQHDEALCHLRRYEKASLLCDLEEAGLKVEKIGYFFFTSFFAVAPIRLFRRLFVSRGTRHSDTTTLPFKPLNEFLKFLFNIEMHFALNNKLPFGTTLFAIASKK